MFTTRLRMASFGGYRSAEAPERGGGQLGHDACDSRGHKNKNPGAIAGAFFTQTQRLLNADATHATENVGARLRLQLSVFAEHGATLVADAPAVSGKRRPAAQQVGPSHAARMIAHSCGGRLAWRELGKIDGLRGSAGKRDQRPDQQAREYHWLHPQSSLAVLGRALHNAFVTGIPAILCDAQT
jgi:hypothetical protein